MGDFASLFRVTDDRWVGVGVVLVAVMIVVVLFLERRRKLVFHRRYYDCCYFVVLLSCLWFRSLALLMFVVWS